LIKCPAGYFRGVDSSCYPTGSVRCNCGGYTYCTAGGECINNQWLNNCPSGYFRGIDSSCYPGGTVLCNCGGYTYCEAGGHCVNNRWVTY
jgi:hypothetical protein